MEEDPKSQRISGSRMSYVAVWRGLAAHKKGLLVGFITAALMVHEPGAGARRLCGGTDGGRGRA